VDGVSLGVQAFDDESLRDNGEAASSADVMDAMEQVRKVGFGSLSIDLIYGYARLHSGKMVGHPGNRTLPGRRCVPALQASHRPTETRSAR